MRGHEEYKEMLAAQALTALDAAEARELEAHLADCAECRAEADSWFEVAATLAHAAPAVEPSAGLRSRILESVRAEARQGESTRATVSDDERPVGRASRSTGSESNVLPFAQRARRSWGTTQKLGVLAAALAFVALVVALIMLWTRYQTTRDEMARLSERMNQTQGELERERAALMSEREAKSLISAPDAQIAALNGTEMATRASAKLVFDRKTGRAMLMADNLPPAPAGKAYQMWYIAEGKPPMPGHVFTPDAAGHVEMRDQLPAEARGAKIFAVTLEPAAGVDAPTGPKYLLSATS